MSIALITGSAGLIGSESVRFFASLGMQVVGIDNDMRRVFFGDEASTQWNLDRLQNEVPQYSHNHLDIRSTESVANLFRHYGKSISLVIHTAAQPSHDWAASDPLTDFSVNANGTLNLLQATRDFCPDAVFLFTSTNKVYGDLPNQLPLIEQSERWEVDRNHACFNGINEDMSIDQSTHSLFGVSKIAADILVQEYGRYFGMKTSVFRGGCLTGPNHAGTQLHGFLAYLMKCAMTGTPYKVLGYKGKQVRDNIHSSDLIDAFYAVFQHPGTAQVYNIGGGRESNCSMLEAIKLCQEICGQELQYTYEKENRIGDHIWYISDLSRFKTQYPDWRIKHTIHDILTEIHESNQARWQRE
jgi:CDP-paratose 2-epimerase